MATDTSQINNLIKHKNPFAGHIVVRPQQIWGKSFPDVSSINAHASNAVFDAVEKVKIGQRDTVGITIEADRGLGKSHIISRIRHRLRTNHDALFVYMGKYDNLNHIKYEFCQTVSSSLRAFSSRNVMQWQEIAASLINDVRDWNYTPEQYIKQIFPTWLSKYSNKVVDTLTEIILRNKLDITNPYIVKAMIWTLSSNHAIYATYWLSGLELTQEQADYLSLPNPKSNDREANSLSIARQIIDIISDYRVPVICFDELDTLDVDDNGFLTAQLVADLVKDLYNSLKRGVFVLAMYPETWERQIKTLPQAPAVIDRLVSEQVNRQPIQLKYLNSDDIVAVVKQWLKDFYEDNQVIPIHSLYPFEESKLRELGKSKPTVRSILRWCAENFTGGQVLHPVQPYFNNELKNVESDMSSLIEDETAIANALKLVFSSLVGETLEGLTIETIQDIQANKSDQGFIDFKIIANNGQVRIGVDVLQQSGGTYVTTALGKLIDYKKFDLTRGCLVRSKKISPGAKLAKERLKALLIEKGGEWVLLQSKDIKPLFAISYVYQKSESYKLSKEQIFDFIKKNKIAVDNPLVCEILSDPSGKEPDNLIDDLPMSIPQANLNIPESIVPDLVAT